MDAYSLQCTLSVCLSVCHTLVVVVVVVVVNSSSTVEPRSSHSYNDIGQLLTNAVVSCMQLLYAILVQFLQGAAIIAQLL